MMNFSEIDKEILRIKEKIKNEVDRINLEEILQYEFELEKYDKSGLDSFNAKIGIYIIFVKKGILKEFKKKWGNNIKKHSPTIIKDRIEIHKNSSKTDLDWIPLYIGKSKNLNYRISQHIDLKIKQTTSSMKLKERESFNSDSFAVKVISIESKYYSFVATYAENHLRDKLKPVVGKK